MLGTKYMLGELIGAGGMAEVFHAVTIGTLGFERSVAVKRVLPKWSASPHYAEMFSDEARIMAALRHRNIVAVSDFARDDEGRLFLVMELVEGANLTSLAATGPVPLAVAIYIVSELLRGLGHMHDCLNAEGKRWGLVHRDLSANNVLLSWDGGVKLSDFGLAKAYASDNSGDSDPYGTIHYMSPEQVGGGPIDRRTDLFAVGVILYELLTGTLPFVGTHKARVMSAILGRPIKPPTAIRPEIPADLEAITLQLLERERERRPENANAAIDALGRCEATSHLAQSELVALLRKRFRLTDAKAGGGEGSRRVTQRTTSPKQGPPAIWVNYSAGNVPVAPVLQAPVELPAGAQEPAARSAGSQAPVMRAAADQVLPALPADSQAPIQLSAGSQAPVVHAAAAQMPPALPADAQASAVLSAGSQIPVEHAAVDQAPSPIPLQPQGAHSFEPVHRRLAAGTLIRNRWLWVAALLLGSTTGSVLVRYATGPTQRSSSASDVPTVQEKLAQEDTAPFPGLCEAQDFQARPARPTPVRSSALAPRAKRRSNTVWEDI